MSQNEETTSRAGLFPFGDLPLEIRELVWEFALPNRRIFHIRSISAQKPFPQTVERQMYFKFYIHHRPPAATSVCKESRTVSLRTGIFLSAYGNHPGVWFNLDTDILYFDRNQRTSFHIKAGESRMYIPGWNRILNVGLEWRAFFRDTPRPVLDETSAGYWRAAIDLLYVYMPNMKTLSYILPKIRHKGRVTWGREPYNAQNYEAVLMPLPAATQIPWRNERETTTNPAEAFNRANLLSTLRDYGLTAPMVTWSEVKADMEKGFEEGEDEGKNNKDEDERDLNPERLWGEEKQMVRKPEILGWWLVRPDAPKTYDSPSIMEFNT